MRHSRLIVLNLIVSFLLFEVISFLLLKQQVRYLYPEYWQNRISYGRGYPRYHFESNESRGFDIAKNSAKVLSSQPAEIRPYMVWGNSIGCFDNEIARDSKYEIYLAGDSVTWGYAPLDKKFGTLIENGLGINVAACGVSHTGQIHQFEKFLEVVRQLGYIPRSVVVNVVNNDIDNDFLHPQATVIDGFQINVVEDSPGMGLLHIKRKSHHELKLELEAQIERNTTSPLGRLDPRHYSAVAVMLSDALFRYIVPESVGFCIDVDLPIIPSCPRTYVKAPYFYQIDSARAEKNRNAILKWIGHSQKHGYRLIFADFNTQLQPSDFDIRKNAAKQDFCKFIMRHAAECFSFVRYLDSQGEHDWRQFRWKRDGHLNIRGNKVYADFLMGILN